MYVFSRRTIQARLDELNGTLTFEQRRGLARRLNKPGNQRLATVWETVLLSALSRLGEVTYEQASNQGRAPDVLFSFRGSDERICLDITSVSDAGLDELNPVALFWDDIEAAAWRSGVPARGLYIDVGHHAVGPRGKSKTTLLLPKRSDMQRVFGSYIKPFLSEIAADARNHHALQISEPGISIRITFNRDQPFMSGTHGLYKAARALHSNPLWNALKGKARQLKGLSEDIIKGIFVCDGGCDLLSQPGHFNEFTPNDIIREFLRQNSSFQFVATFAVERVQRNEHTERSPQYVVVTKLWASPSCNVPNARMLRGLVECVVNELPDPVIDGQNAVYRSNARGYGNGNFGGLQMRIGGKRSSVRISSRSLLALLSGEMSSTEFSAQFQERGALGKGPGMPNPFQRAVEEGRMITRVRIDPAMNGNDDWVTVEFGYPDPLVSPFVVKQHEER